MKLYIHFQEEEFRNKPVTTVVVLNKDTVAFAQLETILYDELHSKGFDTLEKKQLHLWKKGTKREIVLKDGQRLSEQFFNGQELDGTFSPNEKVSNPAPEVQKVENPVSEVQKVQQPVSEAQKVQNQVSEAQKVQNPVSEAQKVQNPVSEAQKVQNPASEAQKVQNPVVQKVQSDEEIKHLQIPDKDTKFQPKTVNDWLKLAYKWRELRCPRKSIQILEQILKTSHSKPHIYEDMVKIYLDADRPEVAMEIVNKGIHRFPDDHQLKLRLAECYAAIKRPDEGIEVLITYSKELRQSGTATTQQRQQVQLALSRAYHSKGQSDMAILIISGVVREMQESNIENMSVLIEYARLTNQLSPVHAKESMQIILSSLVKDSDNKYLQQVFTEQCRTSGALEILYEVLQEAADEPLTLSLLGNVLRCYGGLNEALLLHERGVGFKPLRAQFILSYVHLLEVEYRLEDCFKLMLRYFTEHPEDGVGTLKNKHLLSCVQRVKDKNIYLFSYTAGSGDGRGENQAGSHGDGENQTGCHGSGENEARIPPDRYTEDDLYLLALWFTLVKVLYVGGATCLLPRIIPLLDPYRKTGNLHLTKIRNESAFYSCISKLYNSWWDKSPPTVPALPPSSEKCVYFIGDSHCITPAWNTIMYQNERHVIHPLLSTGTKIWHLRPESTFYPKVNFEHAVRMIPDGASVVCVLGEIDCREGVATCVEKCRYESVEEAIEVLLEVYFKVLTDLQSAHHWRLFVHPVPPVLDVTREIIMKFNEMLEKKLATVSNVTWLPLQSELVDTSTEKTAILKTEYDFDETHLHPSYLNLLESKLAAFE